jgi:hypothetical protein
MTVFKLFLPALLLLFVSACSSNPPSSSEATATAQAVAQTSSEVKLEILDFHTEHRCRSCLAIEKLTRETLDTYFAEEQKEGTIVFRLINADLEKNAALAERFGAFGTTLVLNLEAGSRSQSQDITDFAFKRAWDREQFHAELKAMIEEMLAEGAAQG